MRLRFFCSLLGIATLLSCSRVGDTVDADDGGTTEVTNAKLDGYIFELVIDGSDTTVAPAESARVELYLPDHNPLTDSGAEYTLFTDSEGYFSLEELDSTRYNLLCFGIDNALSLLTGMEAGGADPVTVTDTLRRPASVGGVVIDKTNSRVKATVFVPGTPFFARVDSNGAFLLEAVPGERLQIVVVLENVDTALAPVLDTVDTITPVSGDTIAIDTISVNTTAVDSSTVTPLTIVPLTSNTYNDQNPRIWGTNVVWEASSGTGLEIYLHDGIAVQRLTNNTDDDDSPDVWGDSIVWVRREAYNDAEIFLMDWGTKSTTQLTTNSTEDDFPRIMGGTIVWDGYQGAERVVYENHNNITRQASDNGSWFGRTSGDVICWQTYTGAAYQLYTYNIRTLQLVWHTDQAAPHEHMQISGDTVVWATHDGNDYDIHMVAGSSVTTLTTNLTDDVYPHVSNGKVAWLGSVSGSMEVFLYDGATTMLTDPPTNAADLHMAGDTIVWRASDGNDDEIYYYDGARVVQLTDNDYNDARPRVHGGRIVWMAQDGTDWEIYLARQ